MNMVADRDPQGRTSRAAYAVETMPALRQRMAVAMGIFVFFMGLGTIFEVKNYPERASFSLLLYGIEALAAALGVVAASVPRVREHPKRIAALTAVVLLTCINVYHGYVHAEAERLAIVLGCVLNLVSVLLPWGWVAQTVVATGGLASFAVAAPHLVAHEGVAYAALVLAASGTQSICAAYFLDRYRSEAFHRTAMQTKEAAISSALAHVGETLSKHLGEPDILDRVNHLAVEVIRCDFSSVFLFDEKRGVYWLASNVGSSPEVLAELSQLEFPANSLPILRALRPGALIAIDDTNDDSMVPPELSRRLEVASELVAPVARGDRIIGALVIGYRERRGPFSDREQRLTRGIAHTTAIMVENGRLIADLQSANRLKSEFVATMSHELRTPLNVIMGYAEMLADGIFHPAEPEWTGTIGRIQEHAIELLELVNATLDMGRLESGRETVEIGNVDLDRLLADLGRELKPLAQPPVTLTFANDVGGGPIRTDRVKLKTILKNLVGNALKFTTAGSVHVAVAAAPDPNGEDELAVFSVCDTGIGIAPEHVSMIFDMFRQVDSSSTRRFSGVGLGLHIARRLVDLLGGTIAVESTPGEGSTFTVAVPLERATAPVDETQLARAAR